MMPRFGTKLETAPFCLRITARPLSGRSRIQKLIALCPGSAITRRLDPEQEDMP